MTDSTTMRDRDDNILDPYDFELIAPKDLVVGNKYWRRLLGPTPTHRPGFWYGPMFEVLLTAHDAKRKWYGYRYLDRHGKPDLEEDVSSFCDCGGFAMLFYRKVVHPAPTRSRVVTLLRTEE